MSDNKGPPTRAKDTRSLSSRSGNIHGRAELIAALDSGSWCLVWLLLHLSHLIADTGGIQWIVVDDD
jgi:hypothetical protein